MDSVSLDKKSIVEKTATHAGKTVQEIEEMVKEKQAKFEGLLTGDGAALMVAREFGVELEKKLPAKISGLLDGMKNVNVSAKVVHAFPPKAFEKNGKKGMLQNIVVADDAQEIRLTLWNEQVELFERKKISRGDAIELTNCFVKTFNEKKQLSLSFGGTLEVVGKSPVHEISLAKLSAGQSSVDVEAILDRFFEEKTFNSNNKEGKLLAFILKDDSMTMRGVAWNDAIQQIQKAKQGDKVRIEGAYTKESLNGVELNLGYSARVIVGA